MTPSAFWQGVAEFNHREFYACHDTLESLWMEAIDLDKKFYQGILQIAVACYHLGHYNWQGAVTLLGEGVHRLIPYQPAYKDIDVSKLVADSHHLLRQLQQIAPDDVEAFVTQLSPLANQGLPKITPLIIEKQE